MLIFGHAVSSFMLCFVAIYPLKTPTRINYIKKSLLVILICPKYCQQKEEIFWEMYWMSIHKPDTKYLKLEIVDGTLSTNPNIKPKVSSLAKIKSLLKMPSLEGWKKIILIQYRQEPMSSTIGITMSQLHIICSKKRYKNSQRLSRKKHQNQKKCKKLKSQKKKEKKVPWFIGLTKNQITISLNRKKPKRQEMLLKMILLMPATSYRLLSRPIKINWSVRGLWENLKMATLTR